MTTKVLTNSPLRLAQEGIGQLPCLSSGVRNLNTLLRASSDATGQPLKSEQDKNKSVPENDTSNSFSLSSKLSKSVADMITTKTVVSTALSEEKNYTISSSTVESSKKLSKDEKSDLSCQELDDKENQLPCSDKNFMLAMLSDTLNFSSKGVKSDKNEVFAAKPLDKLNCVHASNSQNLLSNLCGKEHTPVEQKNKTDSSIKVSGNNKIPQSIPGIHQPRPFTVSIEGNIGSGKSTFLKHFASIPGVTTYQEPLWKWTDVGGHNLLGKMYEDTKRWGFLFQSYVQLTRLQIHLTNEQPAKVKLIERSLHNNRYCFVESGHDTGDLQDSEYDVLCEYFEFLEENLDLRIDLIVYLRSTPDVVHQRMQQRGRAEEAGVPLAYLQRLHDYYERWLIKGEPHKPPAPVLVINADSDLTTVTRDYTAQKHVILGQAPYQPKRRGEKRPAQDAEQETLARCLNDDKNS